MPAQVHRRRTHNGNHVVGFTSKIAWREIAVAVLIEYAVAISLGVTVAVGAIVAVFVFNLDLEASGVLSDVFMAFGLVIGVAPNLIAAWYLCKSVDQPRRNTVAYAVVSALLAYAIILTFDDVLQTQLLELAYPLISAALVSGMGCYAESAPN